MLFDPARHERLTPTLWSDGATAEGIARIAGDAAGRFDPDTLGSTHPMDEPRDADPRQASSSGGTARWPKARACAMAPPATATRS